MPQFVCTTPIDYGTEVGTTRFEAGEVVDETTFGESHDQLVGIKALRLLEEDEVVTDGVVDEPAGEPEPEKDPEAKTNVGLPEQAAESTRTVDEPDHL